MLQVAWAMPTCDGGAPVTNFRVKWDVVEQFNSLELYPNKDEVSILVCTIAEHHLPTLAPESSLYLCAVCSVGARAPS